jgi:hypothetical protein
MKTLQYVEHFILNTFSNLIIVINQSKNIQQITVKFCMKIKYFLSFYRYFQFLLITY